MEQDLLDILCCPETRQPLEQADPAKRDELNAAILRREVRDSLGRLVEAPVEDLLVREDGRRGYAVREGIPVLLVDEALVLDGDR